MPEAPQKLDISPLNMADDKRRQLRQLFPEVFTEGTGKDGSPAEINFEKLKQVLGEHGDLIDPAQERYGLEWPGKRDALKAVQAPALGTLSPCPEESTDWDTTQNLFIEGDNLEVLKLLQKSYYGKVKMIYIDPPYNTGNDFVYPDNYAESLETYLRYTGKIDDDGFKTTTNSKDGGRFHSNWLRMMFPRLYVAKNLLRDDGFLLVSCDDAEYANLLSLLNELYGEENYIGTIIWDRNRKNDAKYLSVGHEYMILFANNKETLKEKEILLRTEKPGIDEAKKIFLRLKKKHSNNWEKVTEDWKAYYRSIPLSDPRKPLARFTKVDEHGPYRDDGNISWPGGGGPTFNLLHPTTKKPCKIPSRGWIYSSLKRMNEEIKTGRVCFGVNETTVPTLRTNLFEQTHQVLGSVHYSYAQKAAQDFDKLFEKKRVFDNPKNYLDLQLLIEYLTTKDDLILDFFAGSASSAHAAYAASTKHEKSRPWICVQLPEPIPEKGNTALNARALGAKTIADIAKERIRRAGKKIREELDAKAKETEGELDLSDAQNSKLKTQNSSPDLGFRVFKLTRSNFKRWDGEAAALSPEAMEQQMLDHIAPHATPEGLLYEILLSEGYPLTCQVEKIELAGASVFSVDGGKLMLYLDTHLKLTIVEAAAALHPERFICLDRSLDGDDALKVNTTETLRNAQPEIQFRTI